MCYAQEPSAAAAVTVLDPQPGERVLDLCAAPGGKSTQIAGLLGNTGLLWSNEIVRSRAGALLSNLERMGARNAVVSLLPPPRPSVRGLRGYFHRVLVDAPCSGEGMFRRDPEALGPVDAPVPGSLRPAPGGYSRLRRPSGGGGGRPGLLHLHLLPGGERGARCRPSCGATRSLPWSLSPSPLAGRPWGMPALRIYPMDGGEGHFVARFRRVGENPCRAGAFSPQIPKQERALAQALYQELCAGPVPEGMALVGGPGAPCAPRPCRSSPGWGGAPGRGWKLAEVRGKRLEPCHGFFMSRSRAELRQSLDLFLQDPRLAAFLRGEEIDCDAKGYTAVCVAGVTTGLRQGLLRPAEKPLPQGAAEPVKKQPSCLGGLAAYGGPPPSPAARPGAPRPPARGGGGL